MKEIEKIGLWTPEQLVVAKSVKKFVAARVEQSHVPLRAEAVSDEKHVAVDFYADQRGFVNIQIYADNTVLASMAAEEFFRAADALRRSVVLAGQDEVDHAGDRPETVR